MAADLPSEERSEIYFSDLGPPFAASFQQDPSRGIAWRTFRHAVVAINSGSGTAEIPSLRLELSDPPQGYLFPS